MGIFFGAILLHPTIISMVDEGSLYLFGIPALLQNYSSTLLPIVLTVWIATPVERFFKKVIPASLRVLGVPTLTTFVILPLMLCVLGPLGGFLGTYICEGHHLVRQCHRTFRRPDCRSSVGIPRHDRDASGHDLPDDSCIRGKRLRSDHYAGRCLRFNGGHRHVSRRLFGN